MKVLFLSIGGFQSIEAHDQYPDILREIQRRGHEVYIVCSNEKRNGQSTVFVEDKGARILRVQIGNITQSGLIEKGIATVLLENQYKRAIKKYIKELDFDLIVYTTPPITLAKTVAWLKKKCDAKTYLILKDIFPQNAVDLGMLKTTGCLKILHSYFRRKEKQLYMLSDKIGTMSEANTRYLLEQNKYINENNVEVCPNCLEPRPVTITPSERNQIREKFGIPTDKKVFVYGGNLGKPQDIPHIIQCLRHTKELNDAFFWVFGNGTEYSVLEEFVKKETVSNFKLSARLPKEEYDKIIASCDVGLIFLDYRFSIPNFPSRLLSYMQAGLPVLACTDRQSDIGEVIVGNGFGWYCESDDPKKFRKMIESILDEDLSEKIKNARTHLMDYDCRLVANKLLAIVDR